MKGLTVSVYREASGSDCSNGGVSSRVAGLTVVGFINWIRGYRPTREPLPDDCHVSEPTQDRPAAYIVRQSSDREVYNDYVIPDPDGTGLMGWMFGGNLAAGGDSRWTNLIRGRAALRIHDHRE